MSVRKKIFGSLFILGCIGVVVGAVFFFMGASDETKPSEVLVPRLEELPGLDLALSELDRELFPEFSLPEFTQPSLSELAIGVQDITISFPEVSITPEPMPSFNFNISEFQEMMESIIR